MISNIEEQIFGTINDIGTSLHPLLLGFSPGLPRPEGLPPPLLTSSISSTLSQPPAKGLCHEDISKLESGAGAEAAAVQKKDFSLPKIHLFKLLVSTYSVTG